MAAFLLLVFSSQAFCFPNMRVYPHDVEYFCEFLVAVSLPEDKVILNRCPSTEIESYWGYCDLTGYQISIDEYDNQCFCTLFKDEQPSEVSQFGIKHIESEESSDYIFFFLDGIVVVKTFSKGTAELIWRSFINHS